MGYLVLFECNIVHVLLQLQWILTAHLFRFLGVVIQEEMLLYGWIIEP